MDDLYPHYHEAIQVYEFPVKTGLVINVPADFSDKDWFTVPCRHMRSGLMHMTIADDSAPAVISIACISRIGSAEMRFHTVPLAIVPRVDALDSAIASREFTLPFQVDPHADYLLVRAWRYDDALTAAVPIARVVLSTKQLQENRNNWSDGADCISAVQISNANENIVCSATNLACYSEVGYIVENLHATAAVLPELHLATNVGRNNGRDQHITQEVAIGSVAAGVVLMGSGNAERVDACGVEVRSAAATAIQCRVGVGFQNND
jgi:hypothetical protein